MNKYDKIKQVIELTSARSIALNISDFIEILNYGMSEFKPITDRDILFTGHYGQLSFNNKRVTVWVSKEIIPGFILSSSVNKTSYDSDWSLPICLEWDLSDRGEIDRMWALKVFW